MGNRGSDRHPCRLRRRHRPVRPPRVTPTDVTFDIVMIDPEIGAALGFEGRPRSRDLEAVVRAIDLNKQAAANPALGRLLELLGVDDEEEGPAEAN